MAQATSWRPVNPMPEPRIFDDGSGEPFEPSKEWGDAYVDDPVVWATILDTMILVCTDIIWVNVNNRTLWLASRNVHSTKGPWMFGGRQQRGEFPRDTAERLLRDEVSTAIDPSNLHSLLYGVVRSKYRKLAPQDGGAQYFLCHYCMPVSSAMVAEKQSKLDPKEYDLEHGIQEYDRARLAAFDPEGPYGFNRMILLEEYDRIFGTS